MHDRHDTLVPPRRGRLRRRGRAAMMKGVYFLPSLATLGNAICGFAACYVTTLNPGLESDRLAQRFASDPMLWATYLVFFAAIFDVLDGRLARLTRHTTDFGGQLDSLADVISFGFAPAFIALQLFKTEAPGHLPIFLSRLIWAIGALYLACTAMRLARFNVTNEHGEQHHRSFQGLPSPAAGLGVLSLVLLFDEFRSNDHPSLALAVIYILPLVVLGCALLMVSEVRYPHLMNTVLRGRKSMWKLVAGVVLALLLVVKLNLTVAIACLAFVAMGPIYWPRYRQQLKAERASHGHVSRDGDGSPALSDVPPPT